MSVVVKGMKMPECCRECPFENYYSDTGKTVCMASLRVLAIGFGIISFDGRHSSCPIVALPDKHGDLIDRDAFRADYGMNADCADCEKECRGKTRACEYDRIYSKMDFCSWLDVADVVIEAEDSE